MLTNSIKIWIVLVAVALVVPPRAAAQTRDTSSDSESDSSTTADNGWWEMEVSSREDNSWDVRAEEDERFGERDCLDNVRVNLKVTLGERSLAGDGNIYLFVGDNCDESLSNCIKLAEHIKATTWIWKNIHLRTVFDGTTCAVSETVDLWIGQLESDITYDEDNGDYMSKVMTMTLDVVGPNTIPQDIGVRVNDGSLELSWDKISDSSVKGFVALYWSPEDGPASTDAIMDLTDTGVDTSTETSTETSTDTSTETSTETTTAADTGTDTGTGSTDTASGGCPVSGGFKEFDEVDPLYLSGTKMSLNTGSAALTSLAITGLVNGRSYNVAVVSIDEAGNPSEISEVRCASPQEVSGLDDAYGDTLDGGYCFIATAAFGSYDHPTVKVLRQFRDKFISKVPGGGAFISAYYSVGPSLARILNGQSAELKDSTRDTLTLAAGFASLLMAVGPIGVTAALLLSILAGLLAGIFTPRFLRRN